MATTLSIDTQLLDNALKIGGLKTRKETVNDVMFDYLTLANELSVPEEVIQKFEEEARVEFPYDSMLAEIHILRAVKAYARANMEMVKIEN